MDYNQDVNAYNMNHTNRGFAIIINNTKFRSYTGKRERTGSDRDAIQLFQLFEDWSFDTTIYHNQTTREMMQILLKVAKSDHRESDAFLFAILSHGDDGVVYGTDGVISLETLTDTIKGDRCQSLVGKPKIFIIQACRGFMLDSGTEVADGDSGDEGEHQLPPARIPSEADFLYFYSTVPGYASWRNTATGSYFIQTLCDVMSARDSRGHDLVTLMTRVIQQVAYGFESNTANPALSGMKQIPSIVSMLTKMLYMTPKLQ